MNRLALVACAALATACGGTVRYSKNPIGRAQFVGVAISGDVGAGRRVTDTWSRGLLPYPVYFRTDYRRLGPGGAVSFRGAEPGGRTWTSGLHEAMALTDRDEPFVVLVTDRRGRIRGFSSALGARSAPDPAAELRGLVEDLLLNLDGAEAIADHGEQAGDATGGLAPASGVDAAALAFQTDLEQERVDALRRAQARKSLRRGFMRLLGKPLPDWTVRDAAGRRVSLRALAAGKVTVLALFLAEEGAPLDARAGLAELKEAYRDFGEGLARPGERWVENARPD